ncbi:MAG TPA: nuclear transport factor 2 family protein [Gemmatimonadales bacterium]
MTRPSVRLSIVVAFLAAATTGGHAQVHRSRAPTATSIREAYLEEVARGTTETVDRLKRAFQADNPDDYVREFTPGGLYSPATGESRYGAAAIKVALGRRMPRFGGMTLTRTDWTASGNLAYTFGRYFYGPISEGGAVEQGTYVMVLLMEGREWKIRSYIERVDPGQGE